MALLPTLPSWPAAGDKGKRAGQQTGAHTILTWLLEHPGEGWQDRWVVAGADHNLDWIAPLAAATAQRSAANQVERIRSGLTALLLCRIVMPSYDFLARYRAFALFTYARQVFAPTTFATLEAHGQELMVQRRSLNLALSTLGKIVLHTGRDVDQLTAEDLLTYRAWNFSRYGRIEGALGLAWTLLRTVADLGEHLTIKDAVRFGQRSTSDLVDAYHVESTAVRDVLIRYLDERRPALDYSTFLTLLVFLVGTFWSDIERHHPGIDTLHLPEDVAQAWKQRLRTVTGPDGRTRPRKGYLDILVRIRGVYLDIQELALEDPSWAPWAAPSPIRKDETVGLQKAKKRRTAEMHQRVRDRLPHLPILVDTAENHKADQAALLAKAQTTTVGNIFDHNGRHYRRIVPAAYAKASYRDSTPPTKITDIATGDEIDVGKEEQDAFWAWAIIETLRHTGVRNEELTEITHLALISYELPDTGEIVPMLQIVPSKSNEERLLLISPELASTLATIITRLRMENGGTVPLTSRYDHHERLMGPPLPHLFQRRDGWQWAVPSTNTIQRLLNQTLARTGLVDATGEPLRYTPHDFRRIFATEAVTGGLPVHIVARLLGHTNLNTSQAYMAVFDEELVRSYRAFVDRRRAERPPAEYRDPTDQEWRDFQQHFQARKLELGECGRPYGTPCKHEHACIRCPSLRLDPAARPRLVEIITNLNDRIAEAKLNGWFGEVAGLNTSLQAAARKLVSLDRMRDRQPTGPVDLGIPVIT
jgi:hypothetical protein